MGDLHEALFRHYVVNGRASPRTSTTSYVFWSFAHGKEENLDAICEKLDKIWDEMEPGESRFETNIPLFGKEVEKDIANYQFSLILAYCENLKNKPGGVLGGGTFSYFHPKNFQAIIQKSREIGRKDCEEVLREIEGGKDSEEAFKKPRESASSWDFVKSEGILIPMSAYLGLAFMTIASEMLISILL